MTLAGQALHDGSAWESSNPTLAAMRQEQADELLADLARSCGTYEDGSAPSACAVDRDELARDASDLDPRTSLENLIDAVDDAPEDSRDLLSHLALDFAGALRAEDPEADSGEGAPRFGQPGALNSSDREGAGALIEAEWATIWGLDSAQGFADPSQEEALSRSSQCHRDAAAGIRHAFSESEEKAPEPQPGYQIPAESLPTTPTAAQGYIATLESDSQQRWSEAIAQAHNDEWRRWLTTSAATLRDCSAAQD